MVKTRGRACFLQTPPRGVELVLLNIQTRKRRGPKGLAFLFVANSLGAFCFLFGSGLALRLVTGGFTGVVTTIFVGAMTKRSLLLGSFLQQKWRVAIWTGFRNRFVPIDAIAVGIGGAPIEYFAALRLFNYEFTFATRPRTLNTGRFLLDVFTLRIV